GRAPSRTATSATVRPATSVSACPASASRARLPLSSAPTTWAASTSAAVTSTKRSRPACRAPALNWPCMSRILGSRARASPGPSRGREVAAVRPQQEQRVGAPRPPPLGELLRLGSGRDPERALEDEVARGKRVGVLEHAHRKVLDAPRPEAREGA